MKKYFMFAAAALAMVACSNEESDNSLVQNGDVIRLTASVGNAAQTRAGVAIQSTAFATGEEINVECTPSGGSYSGTMAHAIYVTGEAPTSGDTPGINALTLKVTDPVQNPLRWPAAGAVSIKAYYPSYITSAITDFTVSTDQSEAGDATLQSLDASEEGYAARELARGYKGSDLMYATPISDQNKQTTAVGLTFNHALTKIIVNLTAAENGGLQAADLAGCTVTLHAKKNVAISNGIPTLYENVYSVGGGVADIKMGTGANNAAIIVPQNITAGAGYDFITVTTAGGHAVTYKLTANKVFEHGTVYTYNLTVSTAALVLQSTTINDWVDGDNENPTAGTIEI